MFSLFMIVLTFLLVGGFVIQPLFLKRGGSPVSDDESVNSLNRQKEIVYKQIKEAEMEFEMGNLSRGDFGRIRSQLKEEAAGIIQQLQKRGHKQE